MCKKLIVLVFCAAVLFSGATMAEVDDSGRLIVPEVSVAPIIDGELDDVWQNVGEESLLITEIINATSAVPEDLNDLSATFQVMHDADNFYIYVVIQDSVIDYQFSDWNGDGVELFFDGDNSKGSSYDGVNDNQIRITVDDVELANIESSLPVDGSAFKVILTDLGYNIEASFPLETLQIVPENTFGFEVQLNDNDGGSGRETLIRWFSNDNNSWRDASLFGEAVLTAEPEPPSGMEGWQSQDIGTTGGSAAESDGTWAISADGADVWGSADEFHYAYVPLSGDGTIVARVVSNGEGSNGWAKGGVMIRETLNADSKHMIMALTGGEGGGIAFQGRHQETGANSSSMHGDITAAPPYWVKLTREGNTITGYCSADGVDWTLFTAASPDNAGGPISNPMDVEMTEDVYIGLFVTSHASGEVRTYTFDNVSVVLPDVTAPGDVIQGVPNDGDWPGNETPDLAIDDNVETKYLHFKGDFDPDPGTGGAGLQVTPSVGPTIVTGLTLTTANDVPGRDPIAFELSGSNDSIDGPYELIASGDIVDFAGEAEWPRFTMNATPISFKNDKAYAHYQLIFTAIRGPVGGSVNSMQIAEVELLGELALPGPVGHWKFDEGSGTIAYDSSGNGLDGTLKGDPQWVEGQLGGALDFDGDDSVEIPHNPLLSITDEITIAAWTYMGASASGELAIVSKGGWAANDLPYELTETPGGVIYWQFYDDSGRDTCAPQSPPVDEWHHIAATYDGQIFKCYIDGELADEWAYVGTMPENTASVTIGQRSRGGCYFNGMIDEVRIYDVALTAEEVAALAQ